MAMERVVNIHGDDGWLCSRMGVGVLRCVREAYVARRHDEGGTRPMGDGHGKVEWAIGCSRPRNEKGMAVAWRGVVVRGLVGGVIMA